MSLIELVLVLKRSKGVSREVNVTVSCGGAYENQAVVWKKDGKTTFTTFSYTSTKTDTFKCHLICKTCVPSV